jgi:PAS domain S-box-containing protein
MRLSAFRMTAPTSPVVEVRIMPKFRPLRWRPMLVPYATAGLSVAAALAAALLLDGFLHSTPFVSLFFCAILFAAWLGGFGPGLFAGILSLIALTYCFVPPFSSLHAAMVELPRIALFAVAALFVVSLSAAQRRTAASLRRTRGELQVAVRDLERLNKALQAENSERRRTERQLQVMIDTIPAMAAQYRGDGSLELVNQTWRSYTGLSQDSIRGHRWGVAIHPEDLPLVERAWRAHLVTGEPFQMEQRMLRADGEYRWHQITRVPFRDDNGDVISWYGAGYDIEDHKRAIGALRRSEAYLAEAQRLSMSGSFGWRIGTNEVFWSDQTFRIFEYDPSITPTMDLILQRTHPDDRAVVRLNIDRMRDGQPEIEIPHRLLLPDGRIKDVRCVAHATTDQSGGLEYVGVLMDVTAAKQSRQALEHAQAELAHVTRVTTLGEMTASIAHEVNQPLAAIVTNGEIGVRLLGRTPPELDEALQALRQIVSDAHRASRVIGRIRDLARKADPAMTPLDINQVIGEVITLVQPEAARHGATMRLQPASRLPPVRGDRIQLQQVVINLVMNGVQAMTAVTDRERVLVIRTQRREPDQVVVAVEDAGVGIEPENLGRLFNAFYTTRPEGLGMGLSICRSIIEAHGGRVWVVRNSGPGMTFQFAISAYERAE